MTYTSCNGKRLWQGDPQIALAAADTDGFYVNPQSLKDDELSIIVARLRDALSATST